MAFMTALLIGLFIFVCLILMLLILIQKGRGGGLASAFGGGGGGNTAFGSKTGDVLTWATSIVFAVFVLLAMSLNWMTNARAGAQPAIAPGAQQPIQPQVPPLTSDPAAALDTELPPTTEVEIPADAAVNEAPAEAAAPVVPTEAPVADTPVETPATDTPAPVETPAQTPAEVPQQQ